MKNIIFEWIINMKDTLNIMLECQEYIYKLDVYSSVAWKILVDDLVYNLTWSKPTRGELILNNMFYPLLDKPVLNNVVKSEGTCLIKGQNATGKTTLMRTICTCVILDRIFGWSTCSQGSSIPYIDRIDFRCGTNDNLAFNQSTFVKQMVELTDILKSKTNNSLVCVDEICSSTDYKVGLNLAQAIVNHLEIQDGLTFITTHYPLKSKSKIYMNDFKLSLSTNKKFTNYGWELFRQSLDF